MAAPRGANDDVAMGDQASSITTVPGFGQQTFAMRPQDPNTAAANALGCSPSVVANPLAQMPPAVVRTAVETASRAGMKAQDLALAGMAPGYGARDKDFLFAASLKRLDDDVRTVHANAVQANEEARDSDGWMRWVRFDQGKDISELKMLVKTLYEVLTPLLDEEGKTKMRETVLECSAMRQEKDREYYSSLHPDEQEDQE